MPSALYSTTEMLQTATTPAQNFFGANSEHVPNASIWNNNCAQTAATPAQNFFGPIQPHSAQYALPMQTGQMIIESPDALLPQVFKPYSQWAKKIEAVLHGRNVHNFTDKVIFELLNPVILARLPSRLLRFVSRNNLQ